MTSQSTTVSCDLCGFEDATKCRLPVGGHNEISGTQKRKFYSLSFSSTDPGGHDQDWRKEICDECHKIIKAL